MQLSKHILLVSQLLVSLTLLGREIPSLHGKEATYTRLLSGCTDATSQIEMNINNVRTRLLGAGDLWWDLDDGKYEIPKVDVLAGEIPVSSLFCGALWIGGMDPGKQMKVAAQTYRQSGSDFWPGPIDSNGEISPDDCAAYDRHWKVNKSSIDSFLELSIQYQEIPLELIPASILEWPAKGNPYARGSKAIAITVDRNLAPFVDNDPNKDGLYDPTTGDYPDIDGDQAIFWVFNDVGNVHTESGGEAIGLEIQAMAFGFCTADELNDMTFYRYNLLNFGSSPLDSTFIGNWVDADLGAFDDDYVGCDTTLDLAYCYNGDAIDGPTSPNYSDRPPIIGTDLLQGPKEYFYQSDGTLDSLFLGMTGFLYYDSDFAVTGNPEIAKHYYYLLTNRWKDGIHMTYGGDGYGGTSPTNFMFPDSPKDASPAWSECSQGNTPFDRRYLQSSGPFTLEAGAKNEILIGVPWVRQQSQVGCFANIELLRAADKKAQLLFDSGFKVLDGPDAPDISLRELDKEIILTLSNGPNSNNMGEQYEEADPIVKQIVESDSTLTDSTYNFQGYIIYQLANGQISPSEFDDPDKARVIAQVDLEDGVDKLVNFVFDKEVLAEVPILKVDGNDAGIQHAFNITEDAFAAGDKTLVNHKTYYFSAVAYAFNEFAPYEPSDPNTQGTPYLEGRNNIKIYTAIPHLPAPEIGGTVLQSAFGDGPILQKQDGRGNGGQILDLTAETEAEILAEGFVLTPTYQPRSAAVDVMVVDPLRIPAADFELRLYDSSNDGLDSLLNEAVADWELTNLTTGEMVSSEQALAQGDQQVIPEWGLAVSAGQVQNPGGEPTLLFDTVPFYQQEDQNGFLEATIAYADPSKAWLTGVTDGEAQSLVNWIRSGTFTDNSGCFGDDSLLSSAIAGEYYSEDMEQYYETVLGGTWAPYSLVAHSGQGTSPCIGFPASSKLKISKRLNELATLPSIDIVFTDDRERWTRGPVVTTGDDVGLDPYGDEKGRLRSAPSVDKDGEPDGSGIGMSWFPGYAINVETGERLNIFFGENPFLVNHNGGDMRWNPTSTLLDAFFNPIFGGMHYIYVHQSRYDEGLDLASRLNMDQNFLTAVEAYAGVTWVSMPMLQQGIEVGAENPVQTETRVRLRVTKSLARKSYTGENDGFPMYTFSTRDLAPLINDPLVAQSALDLVNIVPNPYYGFSAYETSQIDNRIKITNLPASCTISIYSLDGALIRRFVRDVPADNTGGSELGSSTSRNLDSTVDWDLKNEQQIPIAGGVYLIHVDAGELGQRTLKWFGVVGPQDLDTF